MLPLADIGGTRPTNSVEAVIPVGHSTDSRQEILQRLTQIAIGTRLDAAVLSQLDDGTYLVRIADTAARMNLPSGTRVGDSLSMTMLSAQPRPTFLLEGQPSSANTNISSGARIISNVLQQAQEQKLAPVIYGKAPIVNNAALLLNSSTTPQIANALQDSVALSGAFYESHLQQWSTGKRTLIEVLKEPQIQINKIALPETLIKQNLPRDTLTQLVQASKMLPPDVVKHLDLSPQQFAEWVKASIPPKTLPNLDALKQKMIQLAQANPAIAPEIMAQLDLSPHELKQSVQTNKNLPPEILAQLDIPEGKFVLEESTELNLQDAKVKQDAIPNELAKLLQNTQAISPELLTRLNLPHNVLAKIVMQIRDAEIVEQPQSDASSNQQLQSTTSLQTDAEVLSSSSKQTPISAEAAQLINIQLNALEQKQIVWQGQLFPGQTMEWEIQEHHQPKQGDESPQAVWQSTVRFSLPTLGTISATIHLIGDQVHVKVNTMTEDAANSLRENSNYLATALGAAGSPLESLVIKNDEKS